MAVEVNGASKEIVALNLFERIAASEGITFSDNPSVGFKSADRKWILDTYAECLNAVENFHLRVND